MESEFGLGLDFEFVFGWDPETDLGLDFQFGLGLIRDFGKVGDQTVFGLLLGNLNLIMMLVFLIWQKHGCPNGVKVIKV